MKRLCAPTRKPVRVAPVRPSAAITSRYQKRLDTEIARMAASVSAAVLRLYRIKPPELAQDESPAAAMRALMGKLRRDWEARFDELAQTAGRKFGRDSVAYSDKAFAAKLRAAGFSVRFDATRVQNDVMRATIAENVALIKSVPQQYLLQVEGDVMRAVQVGGDLAPLAQRLEHNYGVTRRRAQFIARDQSAKVTSAVTRVRQQELGIQYAIWRHSQGGRSPRPEHLAFSGKKYEIEKGAYLEGVWTFPGFQPNCKCVSISIIEGING